MNNFQIKGDKNKNKMESVKAVEVVEKKPYSEDNKSTIDEGSTEKITFTDAVVQVFYVFIYN